MRRAALSLVFALIAPMALAQPMPIDKTNIDDFAIDMDGDGLDEHFTILRTARQHRIIVMEAGAEPGMDGALIAVLNLWLNNTGSPDIEARPNGSVSIFAGCDTCGRFGQQQEYKIAKRDTGYMLVGFTETIHDRALGVVSVCDVNLLSGKAELTSPDETSQMVETDDRAFDVAKLSPVNDGYQPKVCAEFAPAWPE